MPKKSSPIAGFAAKAALSTAPSKGPPLPPTLPASMAADIEKNDSAVALAVATDLDHYRNNRPVNTTRTYVPKQKEWDVRDMPLYD